MTSRRISLSSQLALGLALAAAGPLAAQDTPSQAREKQFDALISSADQLQWLETMSSAPNNVGAPHDKTNAEMIQRLMASWGWDSKIESFSVLYPTPISTTLELVTPDRVTLGGQEPVVSADPTSGLAGMIPPYVAYQGDGDVTAPVVYVNYGMPEDYDALAQRGIDVKGKIVLARYGAGWRGLKPRLAQEHGAVGTLIYSDPADDGYADGASYPEGGARPEGGVQRGSVMDMTTFPGDPLTPGIGATADAKRLTRAQATTILRVPTLPISYGDAAKIMARLQGPVVTGRQRGGMGMAYRWGGTDAVKAHLAVQSDWSQKTIYNVISTMKGKLYPNEWVVRGNHHDGWVFGASDPLTGNVAMLSEAKALGQLARAGWRPDRTIVYASWDGEEPGLLGSTEWGEQHAAELKKKALLYINTDSNGRGYLGAQASHDLQHFVNGAARDVIDPQTGVTVLDRQRAGILAEDYANPGRYPRRMVEAARGGGDVPVSGLGSGSDYTVFLHHLGVPSINLGFGGEGSGGGSYHSIYDSLYHVTQFDDPGLVYGAALSKVTGRLVMRAATGPRVPARYGDMASTVAGYVDEVMKLADKQRADDRALKQLKADEVFKRASDPRDPTVAPEFRGVTPLIDMLALQDASDRLGRSAGAADALIGRLDALPPATRSAVIADLAHIDQLLLTDGGLPGRPWFRNTIYAPGTLTGYGVKTLPGIREAIEQRRFDDATSYVAKTAAALNAYSDQLDKAVARARP
jgi:N-acetylated-alpha-linked acidic dipeptidase